MREERRKRIAGGAFFHCCSATLLIALCIVPIVLCLAFLQPPARILVVVNTTTSTTTMTLPPTTTTTMTTTDITSTTTDTTSTLSATTTQPSAFTLICPPDQYEEMESLNVATNYTIVGSGCGNLPITVTSTPTSIAYNKKKAEAQVIARVNNSTLSNETLVQVTGNVQQNVQPMVYTLAEVQAMFQNMSTHRPANGKRDPFTGDTQFLADTNTFGTYFPFSFAATDELYTNSDGNDVWTLFNTNVGTNLGFFAATSDWTSSGGYIDYTTLFPVQCIGPGNNAYYVRFQHEFQIFLVATISNNGWLCVAKSVTDDPSGTYNVGSFDTTSFATPWNGQGFSLSLWGDYFYVCYQDASGNPLAWVGLSPTFSTLGTGVFLLPVSSYYPSIPSNVPFYALHQGISTRGPAFSTLTCGALCFLSNGDSKVKCLGCATLDQFSLVLTVTLFEFTVTGGWDDGSASNCLTPGVACIVTGQASNKFAMSGHMRMAYYNYVPAGGTEKFALVWTQNPATSPSLLWQELSDFNSLCQDGTSTSISPGTLIYGGLPNTQYYYAATPMYDCRGSLIIGFLVGDTSLAKGPAPAMSLRYATDPIGFIRVPFVDFNQANGASIISSGMVSMSQVKIPQARPFAFCFTTDDPQGSCIRYYERDLTVEILYTATDQCSVQQTCTQTIYYSTRVPCDASLYN